MANPDEAAARLRLDRRRFLAGSAVGLGAAALPALANGNGAPAAASLTRGDLAAVEKLAGLAFSDADRDLMLEDVTELRADYAALRGVRLDNAVPPALRFDPALPGMPPPAGASSFRLLPAPPPVRPADPEALAFLPATTLGRLIASGQITSVEVTRLYLERLKRFDPLLQAVVTLTEERALDEADRMDRELAAGRPRGPLHGVPWGAKDLLAARGYPTTWGAGPFQRQVIDEDATVVERLGAAGAVLVAKTTLGELAWGDVWFGGTTKNPWNLEQGSSGSSAGSAATTAAGLVGFAIGSETLGSIVSPLHPHRRDRPAPDVRAGAAPRRDGAFLDDGQAGADLPQRRGLRRGLRRHRRPGRAGPDGDRGAVRLGAAARPAAPARRLCEGPFRGRAGRGAQGVARLRSRDAGGVASARVSTRADRPARAAGAGARVDPLRRGGRRLRRADPQRRRRPPGAPDPPRLAQRLPRRPHRAGGRVRAGQPRAHAPDGGDGRAPGGRRPHVAPTYGGDNLLITNLTGHPAVVLPNGFRKDGTPTSITFTGRLWGEAELLAFAKLCQDATDFHLRRPSLRPLAAPATERRR